MNSRMFATSQMGQMCIRIWETDKLTIAVGGFNMFQLCVVSEVLEDS